MKKNHKMDLQRISSKFVKFVAILSLLIFNGCKDNSETSKVIQSELEQLSAKSDEFVMASIYSCSKCFVGKINNYVVRHNKKELPLLIFMEKNEKKPDIENLSSQVTVFYFDDIELLEKITVLSQKKISPFLISFNKYNRLEVCGLE